MRLVPALTLLATSVLMVAFQVLLRFQVVCLFALDDFQVFLAHPVEKMPSLPLHPMVLVPAPTQFSLVLLMKIFIIIPVLHPVLMVLLSPTPITRSLAPSARATWISTSPMRPVTTSIAMTAAPSSSLGISRGTARPAISRGADYASTPGYLYSFWQSGY